MAILAGQTLLDNGDALRIPHVVIQAIKCILVIPASNADPERSFLTAIRLRRGFSAHMPSTFKISEWFMKHEGKPIVSGAAQDLVKHLPSIP
ncbi:hypothetical protein GCK32_007484 [Trichostrongylus colubriformis]|uniref:HAT C-terminal dimerisation domain-containing protein n=1 Tax=Trichostrongylus colubriformis TaxID=6319 RepID=A0AAN8FP25_TRICO